MPDSILVSTAARLCPNHGYRFDGDFVHLNAEVFFSADDIARGDAWTLQLLANENGFSGDEPNGVIVAELALQPIDGVLSAAGCCAAFPPASGNPQMLGLALIARRSEGTTQLSDLAVYPATETFLQPRFIGSVSCDIAEGQAHIYVETIVNPRSSGDLSGTLVLEAWALDTPYVGGHWQGTPVASAVVGVIAGGSQWSSYKVQVPALTPKDGTVLTLMLREWSTSGYVTRDYRNIDAAILNEVAIVIDKPQGDAVVAAKLVAHTNAATFMAAEKDSVPTRRKLTPEVKKHIPAKKKGARSAHKTTASKHR